MTTRSFDRVQVLAQHVTASRGSGSDVIDRVVRATPEDVGISSERLRHLDVFFSNLLVENRGEPSIEGRQCLAGCVLAVARHGKLCHMSVQGVRDLSVGDPMTVDTIFRIHSMTKIVTGVAAMHLYEKGAFQLDDPVYRFLPCFEKSLVSGGEAGLQPLQRHITFRHLLTHTSGLTYAHAADDPAIERAYRETPSSRPLEARSLDEFVQGLANVPLKFQPGEGFMYGHSTDVMGRLIEILSGKPLDAYFRDHIFEPLGMNDTNFWVSDADAHRVATLYAPGPNGLPQPVHNTNTVIRTPPSVLMGGGGLLSTLPDSVRFSLMLAGKGTLGSTRILGRKTVELMTQNHLPNLQDVASLEVAQGGLPDFPHKRGLGCGLGVFVVLNQEFGVNCSAGTYFWQGVGSTYFFHDPLEELTVVAMAQYVPVYHRNVSHINFALRSLTEQAIVD